MAKNTFFIRTQVIAPAGTAFTEAELDLGSYTNLGSSKPEVLRIHNIQASMTDNVGQLPVMTKDKGGSACWQLTTQSQSATITPIDDSYVSGGVWAGRNPDGGDDLPASQTDAEQILAQDWTNGVVIAVPSLFLGAFATGNFTESVYFTLILECSTEAMSKANAVSLAISQQ